MTQEEILRHNDAVKNSEWARREQMRRQAVLAASEARLRAEIHTASVSGDELALEQLAEQHEAAWEAVAERQHGIR